MAARDWINGSDPVVEEAIIISMVPLSNSVGDPSDPGERARLHLVA